MDTFFFIINNDDCLKKIYFKATLTNVESVDYLSTIDNLYKSMKSSWLTETTYKTSIEIRKMYKYKINEHRIFFKEQIKFSSFCLNNNTR